MRYNKLAIVATFFCSLIFTKSKAQLALGDIAFTGYNSTSSIAADDDFSFVVLKIGGLPANSVITFTDCAWVGPSTNACNGNFLAAVNSPSETDIIWTSPNTVLNYGTQVYIKAASASSGTVSGAGLSLSSSGDQIFAFTGNRTAPNFIAAIHMNCVNGFSSAANWDNITINSGSSSSRPQCLTNNLYAIWVSSGSDEYDGGYLSLSNCLSGDRTNDLKLVNDYFYWGLSISSTLSLNSSPFNFCNATWNGSNWAIGNVLNTYPLFDKPSAFTNAVIASNSAVAASFTCKSLTINSGVALTTTGITATVNGNITNNGDGIAGTGNLVIASSSSLSGNAFSFGGNLTVSSGATLTTNDKLTLSNDATNTGRIGNSAGSISGNVTVQRYIPGGRRAFRFLGHPFTTAQAMSSLTDDIFVTGDGTVDATGNTTGAGFDATLTNAPSSYWFDNTSNTWKAFTTAADASWVQHRGARILVRGDRTQANALTGASYTPNPVTLDMTGAVNTGNQTINLTNANNYHLVSNPYPSPTDIGTVIQGASNLGTLYWVWNANAGSRGQYVNRLIVDGAYNLAMNGAFFVQPTASTSLAFTESNKQATATQGLFRTASSTRPAGYLELAVKQNNEVADNIYIRDLASALTTKDVEDGGKLINPDINIYTLTSNNEQLTLDARPISSTTVIPVVFTSNIQTSFSIEVIDNGLGNGLPIVLKDKFLNVEHVLTATSPYNFTVTSNAASQGTNRFELVFKSSAALPTNFVNVAAQQKGSAIEVTFNTANEQNMHSYEVEESKDGSSFTKGITLEAKNAATNSYSWLDVTVHNGNNYYRIKAIEKNGAVKYSQVVRVNIGTKRSEFTVYPNPVKGGTINLQLTDIEKGVYAVKVVNNIGQEIAARTITHNGGSATQTISIGNAPTGKYNMVITNGTTSVTKTVIVE